MLVRATPGLYGFLEMVTRGKEKAALERGLEVFPRKVMGY
jgi:hypothetical protein